jgi:hypothetical protein
MEIKNLNSSQRYLLYLLISFLFIFVLVSVFATSDVNDESSAYISSFLGKGGINPGEIKDVRSVDQSELPDGIDIKEISENQLSIYEAKIEKEGTEKNLFIITYSTDKFLPKKEIQTKSIAYLNFGKKNIQSSSEFLDSFSGSELGYVMVREGSITGISTNTELSGTGFLRVKVFLNGEDTGFENLIVSEGGNEVDFDSQSEGIVTFYPSDVIQVYVESNLNVNEIVSLVEITN